MAEVDRDGLTILATLSALAGLASVVWLAVTNEPVRLADGCGWDGAQYCKIAEGGLADRPYGRRQLLSWMARGMTDVVGSVPARFLILDLVAVALLVVVVVSFTAELCRRQSVDPHRRRSALLIAGAVVVVNPYTVRYALQLPVNTDIGSCALALLWLRLATRQRWAQWSPVVAMLAVFARDAWAPALLFAAAVLVVTDRRVAHLNAALAVIVSALLVGRLPMTDHWATTDLVDAARLQWDRYAEQGQGPLYVWQAVFAIGLIPLLARRLTGPVVGLGALAVGTVPAALLGGFDLSRYLHPAFLLMLPIAVSAAAANRRADRSLVVAVSATFILWRPWQVVDGSPDAITRWWATPVHTWDVYSSRLHTDLVVALLAAVLMAASYRQNRTHSRASLHLDDTAEAERVPVRPCEGRGAAHERAGAEHVHSGRAVVEAHADGPEDRGRRVVGATDQLPTLGGNSSGQGE